MTPHDRYLLESTRRHFFGRCAVGMGTMALAWLLDEARLTASAPPVASGLHHPPRAKRVIYLFMAGGPSQLDLFDPKPKLNELHGKPTPASFLAGKRFAFLRDTPN